MFGLFEKRKQNDPKEFFKASVLIVEDEGIDRVFAERILTKNHFQVWTAPNGKEGISLAEKHIPDVILMDYYLPDMNGLEVSYRIKRSQRTKDIPIIFISFVEDGYTILQFYEVGAGYLPKPVSAQEMLNEIQFVLNEKQVESKNKP